MTEEYLSAACAASFRLTVERSVFYGEASPLEDAAHAARVLADAVRRYPDATHHCYAYVADALGNELKFSDDGEPQGTAGLPILDCLQKRGLVKTIVVVTRYFGGIKLGAGGLVRAYSSAASGALDVAGVSLVKYAAFFEAAMDYPTWSALRPALDRLNLEVLGVDYGGEVVLRYVAARSAAEAAASALTDLARGRIALKKVKEDYYPFQK